MNESQMPDDCLITKFSEILAKRLDLSPRAAIQPRFKSLRYVHLYVEIGGQVESVEFLELRKPLPKPLGQFRELILAQVQYSQACACFDVWYRAFKLVVVQQQALQSAESSAIEGGKTAREFVFGQIELLQRR